MFQEVKEQSGFPHSWLCNQGHESPLGLDPIEQRCHCFKMGRAEVKKMRIGSNPERLLAKTEVIEEHWLYLSADSWKENHQLGRIQTDTAGTLDRATFLEWPGIEIRSQSGDGNKAFHL